MAAVPAAARLTEAHRIAQTRLGAQTVAAMRAIWPLLDPNDLDRSTRRWLTAAMPVIRSQRTTSSRLAANYLRTFKAIEIGGVQAPVVLNETVAIAQLSTSLAVTGPIHVKQAMSRGVSVVQAMKTAEATSAAAAMRLSLDAGRGTVLRSIRADDEALGYARAASGNACAFCAMLASRGPVYGEESVDFAAHDHCSCGFEPVYRDDSPWPAGSERYRDMWQESKAADGDTLSNFRRAVTGA